MIFEQRVLNLNYKISPSNMSKMEPNFAIPSYWKGSNMAAVLPT